MSDAAGSRDEIAAAREAGLRYVTDDRPGITRRRAGKGFTYRDPFGGRIVDRAEIKRIRAIGIPPAWTSVWICPNPRGHVQATGRDAKGRKQYRYHPDWRAVRDASKFDRMLAFGEALPTLRARLEADLALPGLTRERVLATVVWIIDETLMRVGNEEYARTNDSYGATTLRNDHIEIDGSEVLVSFRGKHGKEHRAGFRDRRIAAILRRCQELPGESLFTYLDELGEVRGVDSGDVNDYLREIAGEALPVKDFRTWGGSVRCFQLLSAPGEASGRQELQAFVRDVIKQVALHLGNTPAVARSSYVHPGILQAFGEGSLEVPAALVNERLAPEEARFIAFLRALASAQPAAVARAS
ncbi:MAG: topoisomerase [Gaiellales bacterium]|nr:topoisomerase [Gaiellales bacterium]